MAHWEYRKGYIAKHGTTPNQADEALADPYAVTLTPDPTSKSGVSTRTIGYSSTAGCLLTVITVTSDGVVYGANCWKSNTRDQRIYQEKNSDT